MELGGLSLSLKKEKKCWQKFVSLTYPQGCYEKWIVTIHIIHMRLDYILNLACKAITRLRFLFAQEAAATAPRQSPSLVCGSNELQSRRSPIQIEKGLLTVEKPVDSGNYRQGPLEFHVPISFGNLLIGTTNTSVKFLWFQTRNKKREKRLAAPKKAVQWSCHTYIVFYCIGEMVFGFSGTPDCFWVICLRVISCCYCSGWLVVGCVQASCDLLTSVSNKGHLTVWDGPYNHINHAQGKLHDSSQERHLEILVLWILRKSNFVNSLVNLGGLSFIILWAWVEEFWGF